MIQKYLKLLKKNIDFILKILIITLLIALILVSPSKIKETLDIYSHSPCFTVFHFLKIYQRAWINFNQKVEELQQSDHIIQQLTQENIHLKQRLETIHFEKTQQEAKLLSQKKGAQFQLETGSAQGFPPSYYEYKPPVHLSLSQLHTLAAVYFKAKENEKAAIIFSLLSQQKDMTEYQTPQHLLLTAISWYRVKNYHLADYYLNEILHKPEQEKILPEQARARAWKAILAHQLGKKVKTQYWLKELLEHHPHAPETAIINLQHSETP